MSKIELISRDEAFEIGDAECAFTLRRMHPDVLRDIRRQHTRRVEPAGPGELPQWEMDEGEIEKDVLDYIIQDWRGVEMAGGSPAPCTRGNKHALPTSIKNEIFAAAGAMNLQGDFSGPLRHLKATFEKAETPTA